MIINMYVTLFPVILAGIFNMAFVKKPILNKLLLPLDFGIELRDNKRLFGENKTFKGALGMIIGGVLCAVMWGIILNVLNLSNYNFFYINNANTVLFNVSIGFLLGLVYILFELPNSFMKRRIDISPGKVSDSKLKYLFVFIDQADSIIGCVLLVHIYYPLTLFSIVLFTLIGAFTHIIINLILFSLKLRKNRF